MRWMHWALACVLGTTAAAQQPALPKYTTGPASGDPMAVGKAAMEHGDSKAALEFFSKYVEENPKDAEGWFYLGGADLGLEKPADAAKAFQECLRLKPDAWGAHNNLALAYAETLDWAKFDEERAKVRAARDANVSAAAQQDHDIVDVLHVNGKVYQVWYFYKLHGKFNVRYVAIYFGKDGKAESWLQAESDDVDQFSYQKEHPKEAKAGDRRFSLDTYQQSSSGYPSQGLIKFYDGEPTYEQFRADVLKSLAGKETPTATVTPAVGDKGKK